MFVRACPRPMHNVLCAGTIEARALWIRTRESGISLRRWRRLCHGGPPVVRNGPKDTDLTPVAPRYCSPGLPLFVVDCYFTLIIAFEKFFVKTLNEDLVLSQKMSFQPKSIHCLNHGFQQYRKVSH